MLRVERFEYVRFGDLLAVARLTGGLHRDYATVPSDAGLSVGFGSYRAMSPARDVRIEDRSSWRRWDGGLVWTASFAVALQVVEHPGSLFELVAPGRWTLALPAPRLRDVTAVFGAGDHGGPRVRGGGNRRRVAAAAVTLAFTATSTPALAATVSSAPWHSVHPRDKGAGRIKHVLSVAAVPDPDKPKVTLPEATSPATLRHRHPVVPVHHAHTHPVVPPKHEHAHPVVPRKHVHTRPVVPPKHTHTAPVAPPKHTHTQPVVPPKHTHTHTQPVVPPKHTHTQPVAPPKHTHTHTQPVAPHHHARSTGGASIFTPPASISHLHSTAPHKLSPAPQAAPTAIVSAPTTQSTYVPAGDAAAYSRLSALLANGDQPPAFLIPIYKAAAHRYHVPWRILAAINFIESDYGRNMGTSSAGAVGWMQFMPSTWAEYGVDVDHRGAPNPYNPHDAIYAAARYLQANGARHDLRSAIFGYNHATWYVNEVMATAAVIGDNPVHADARTNQQLGAMLTMARLLNGDPYVWGGGHGGWQFVGGYDCSGFVSKVLHAAGYLSEPQTTQTLPSQPGILPGPGQFVTIFDRTDAGNGSDHVIIDINGQWWESGGSSAAGGGASVHRITDISPAYLATFNQILHPQGL